MIKMKTKTLLFLALLIMSPAISHGQIRNLVKNKASKVFNTVGKSAKKEANKEIDSVAQKQADKVIDDAASKRKENKQGNQADGQGNQGQGGVNLGKLFAGKVDLKYNEDYKFTSRMYMQTESYDKKEVVKMDYYTYFNANSPNAGIETKSIDDGKGSQAPIATSMIIDGENKCFLMLTDINGQKMGIISAVPDENTTQTQTDPKTTEKAIPPTVTKTGNTKVIAGYKCDEYVYKETDSKGMGKIWFSKDVDLKIDKRGWAKAGMPAYYGYAGFNEGIILAWESYDENGKLSAKSETKEINTNFNHAISTKGYPLRQMNLNQMQTQKK
jgi:hypothetical protein